MNNKKKKRQGTKSSIDTATHNQTLKQQKITKWQESLYTYQY
jgi:hypothetical protein